MFVVIVTNKKTGLKTLMGFAGETSVFDDPQQASAQAEKTYGKENANVSFEPRQIAVLQRKAVKIQAKKKSGPIPERNVDKPRAKKRR